MANLQPRGLVGAVAVAQRGSVFRAARFCRGALTASLVAGACLTAASAQDVPAPPWLADAGVKVYREKYIPGPANKAFAVAPSSQLGWATKRESSGRAAQIALLNCIEEVVVGPCYLYAVNDNPVIDIYQIAASDTLAVLARMTPPREPTAANETKDAGLEPTYEPKVGKLVGPTPMTSPYALNVTTADLAILLTAKDKPLVLDVIEPARDYKKPAIPGAIWIGGAGIHDEKLNKRIDQNLGRVMAGLTPKKETHIVVYCADWQCWGAYNAMQRLYVLGYRKLFWYRGGLASWTKSGLPVVEVPLSAQVMPLK